MTSPGVTPPAAAPAGSTATSGTEPLAVDTPPGPPSAAASHGESAELLIWLAFGWVLAAWLAVALTSALAALAIHLRYPAGADAATSHPATLIYALATLPTLPLMLLWAARRRARVVGDGSVPAGFGDGPLRRPALLGLLSLLHAVAVAAWLAFLDHGGRPAPLPADAKATGFVIVLALLVILISPLAEELFFRGWLWTGLRRHWHPVPVMLATASAWLLVHLGEGLAKPLYLVPAAISLSLVRHYCGLRAGILLHGANNLVASGLFPLLLGLGATV